MACSGCQQQRAQQQIQQNITGQSISPNQPDTNESLFKRKLGRCKTCMNIAATGTIFAWSLFACTIIFRCNSCMNPWMLIIMTGVAAITFSAVLGAHIVAYLKHKRNGLPPIA